MSLVARVKEAAAAAIDALYGSAVPADAILINQTKPEFEGDYTVVLFALVKPLRKSPEGLGQELGAAMVERHPELFTRCNVIKGFLNLTLADAVLFEFLGNPAIAKAPGGRKVMVEYSSPNTNKPLHLGHLRNNFLGYSVSEILKANGMDVRKVNLVNDRGIHICKSMIAYQQLGRGETPSEAGMKGDKLVGHYYVAFDKAYKQEIEQLKAAGKTEDEAKKEAPIMQAAQNMLRKWEEGDAETVALWKQMNGWVYEGFDQTYRSIGVDFDQYYYESETYLLGKKIVEEGLEKGVFFRKPDGSVWIDLTDEGLDEKLLLRADGTSVYITQDIGTADLKYNDFKFEQSIYVVGNEQDYHFKVLQLILKKLGRPYADAIYHLSYGMVDLPSGKMKSREGTVVDADDLVAEMVDTARQKTDELGKIEGFSPEEAQRLYHVLAMGALKFFLLKVDPKKRMLFNPEESIDFKGNTGPFVQYTHARIAAIMRKAAEQQVPAGTESFTDLTQLHEAEQETVSLLAQFPKVVADAGANLAPSGIAQFCFDLAKSYNRFYTELSIFQEPDMTKRNFRVALSGQVARAIRVGMGLLGIQVPDRM